MLSKVRAVGAVVLAFSLACAGGEALDQEHGRGEPAPEPNEGASSARAAEGVPGAEEGAVLGGGDTPDITEGSNTNWRPLDPEPGSAPVVKPSRNGAAGTTAPSANTAPTNTPRANTPSANTPGGKTASGTNAASPGPVAP